MPRASVGRIASVSYIGIMSLLVMALGYTSFSVDYKYSGLLFVARDIQLGRAEARAIIDDVLPVAAAIPVERVCRSDILKAGLTVYLNHLDLQDVGRDYDGWEKASVATLGYINHALGCLPSDGNLWLRLAMVVRSISEEPVRVSNLILRSWRFAPAEILIIRGRLKFYNRLSATTLNAARDAVRADLLAMLAQNPKILRTVLDKPSTAMMPYLVGAMRERNFPCRSKWDACIALQLAS